ncbi:helix-turn-helix domain-containing protein [Melghirimyces algeriensis]|uniref:Cytoskeleton protein RodZ-like C-terminal domain-containing protein n=1 Tax=Melghirimyces algeriensis TaxID=910412 RepID=A0A521C8E2_9BACL|nr:helix-turn-helix domain-containing protein [Melghirimyces algeriensis]SMO55757.1 protein of unknown function [Melghirimyces algeriensis]
MEKSTDQLRRMREQAGLTLEDVQMRTNIHEYYLHAVEQGDFFSLPSKFYGRVYIRTYAKFLGQDPKPYIRYFEHMWSKSLEEEEPSTDASPDLGMSRKERFATRRSSTTEGARSFFSTWMKTRKGYVWFSLVLIIFAVSGMVYYFTMEEKSPNHKEQDVVDQVEKKPEKSDHDFKVRLVRPSETYKYGDMFEVYKAKEVEVVLEARQKTWFRYRAGGPTEKVVEQSEISAGEKKTFRHPKWVSLMIGNPAFVKLTVNGHVIKTSETSESHAYQLKLKK